VRYEIDRSDRIVWVCDDWDPFARQNGAPHLTAKEVLGQSIWDHVTGDENRYLYRQIHDAVRSGRSVSFPLRCDSPDLRRLLDVTLTPRTDLRVHFETAVRSVEPREHVALLDVQAPRSEKPLRICAWCKRVQLPARQWVEVEEAVVALRLFEQDRLPILTHGICPPCAEAVQKAISEDPAQ
jgi:hypothetical protein